MRLCQRPRRWRKRPSADHSPSRLAPVELRRRITRVRVIADHFLSLTEAEADLVLRSAGAPRQTPAGWSGYSREGRRESVVRILGDVSDDVLATLHDFAKQDGAQGRSPRALVSVSPPRASPSHRPAADATPAVDERGAIFVVHGHATGPLHQTVRMLERTTSREVVVLHEQPNAGRTILEKFEDHAAAAAYAVVLLTPDDEGGARASSERRPRARQNVVFELGFFFGKLGRGRVAVLLDPLVEKPSDMDGLVYVPLDGGGGWKQLLARELKSAAIDVALDRIP